MKYNYATQEISISIEELQKAFSDIKEYNQLLDDITYLWLTEACGFTAKEVKKFINIGKPKMKRGEK